MKKRGSKDKIESKLNRLLKLESEELKELKQKFEEEPESSKKKISIEELEKLGHQIELPNSYENPLREEELKNLGPKEHIQWKAMMLRKDKENIAPQEGILVLNLNRKRGDIIEKNYIGGATFLEIHTAFELEKKIFLYNPIPKNPYFEDELIGFNPKIIHGKLEAIV